jgi:hypothetical protein
LLRQCATPGHTDHVDLLVAKTIEQLVGQPRETRKPPRAPAHLRSTHSGHIEDQDLPVGQGFHEWKTQLEIGANAIEQQQWQAGLALLRGDAEVDAVHLDEFDQRLAHLW